MSSPIWEIRFLDGRGATVFTAADLTADVGRLGATRVVPVASDVSEERALADARSCISAGDVVEMTLHLGAVAYVIRHD
jgi:hypothetical protein